MHVRIVCTLRAIQLILSTAFATHPLHLKGRSPHAPLCMSVAACVYGRMCACVCVSMSGTQHHVSSGN